MILFTDVLIDDENNEENRIWCIVTYASWLRIYDSTMNFVHFLLPFLINLVSCYSNYVEECSSTNKYHKNRAFLQLLHEQFQERKHLLEAPFLIIIFSVPRLIISLVSGCKKSTRHSWPYLIVYILSFIPPMLTFVLFILPSKIYMKEYRQTIQRYRTAIRTLSNSFRRK